MLTGTILIIMLPKVTIRLKHSGCTAILTTYIAFDTRCFTGNALIAGGCTTGAYALAIRTIHYLPYYKG